MKQTFHDKLRSPWVPIGLALATIAFIAGVALGTGAEADPPPKPTPSPPQPSDPGYVAPADTLRTIEARNQRASAASASVRYPTPTPRSKAEAEHFSAPDSTAYISEMDKVLYLPNGIKYDKVAGGISCAADEFGVSCPHMPFCKFEKGCLSIILDREGILYHNGLTETQLATFQFTKKAVSRYQDVSAFSSKEPCAK